MGVDTTHPDYDKFAPKWKRARDCVAGQDAIHKAGKDYLPRLKDEQDDDYKARVKRSDYFNGTWRTIAALAGMAFRKPPTVDVPAGIESYLEDVTMAGVSMDSLAMDVLDEVLSVGRIGILVDHPPKPENVATLTIEAANRRGLRPTIQTYPAESIINWKFGRVANSWQLTMVVLKEKKAVAKDEFTDEMEDRWRVLDLDGPGFYRQRVFRKKDGKEGEFEQDGNDIYPLMNNNKLAYIPFAMLGADGRGDAIDEPPLIDLIDANLALYQINADYRHGLHFTGLPTPVISGYTKEGNERIYIGSSEAWVFPDPQAKAAYLEFTGQGLEALLSAIKEKKQEMAMLGARMIADETKQAETLGATQIKRQGENSVLARIVQAVSEGLEWALGIFAEWAGHSGEITYQINRDFLPTMLDAQQLTALLANWQGGAISSEEYFDLLQRGDVIAADVTFEEHEEKVDSAAMPRPAANAEDEAA